MLPSSLRWGTGPAIVSWFHVTFLFRFFLWVPNLAAFFLKLNFHAKTCWWLGAFARHISISSVFCYHICMQIGCARQRRERGRWRDRSLGNQQSENGQFWGSRRLLIKEWVVRLEVVEFSKKLQFILSWCLFLKYLKNNA